MIVAEMDTVALAVDLVTMSYGVEGNPLGGLGILGPTRMDYSSSTSAVNAVARYVGRFLIDSQS